MPTNPEVAPHVGAWIEIDFLGRKIDAFPSHPTWVRGLKFTLYICVLAVSSVAPHVGAWIEIFDVQIGDVAQKSHPTWVRGLKCQISFGLG